MSSPTQISLSLFENFLSNTAKLESTLGESNIAIVYAILSSFLFTLAGFYTKFSSLAQHYPIFIYFRGFYGIIISYFVINFMKQSLVIKSKKSLLLLLFRHSLMLLNTFFYLYLIQIRSLSTVHIINNMAPIFVYVINVMFFHETLS